MIASRKDRKPENDNYRELAKYIADTKNEGEKVLMHWSAGCSFDDYLAGICEVEAIQEQNNRSKKTKTYHLVVSFRPEDEAKLSAEAFIDIEKAFALALGYENHQRHCGVHKNTDHPHLHLAYNMIDGEKFWRKSPFLDYYTVGRVCREMEKKYGLSVDPGIEPGNPKRTGQASARVKSIEAQSGQESLFSYILRHKDNLMREIEKAVSWPEVHAAFLKRGLLLKPYGNGLTLQDRYGKHRARPSQVDRSLGQGPLEKRFGMFQPPSPERLRDSTTLESYSAIPLHLGPERDKLYAIFQEELLWHRKVLDEINQEGRALYDAHKQKWAAKREHFKRLPMMKRDRDSLYLELKKRERKDLEKIRAETAKRRNSVRALMPYTTWSKCLQHKAALGNETALAILRSKKEVVEPEIIVPRQETAAHQSPEVRQWQERKRGILDLTGISNRTRRALLSVLKMREVFSKESGFPEEPKYRIDGNGTVIYELPGGGTIRDTGREIHFSHHDRSAPDLALKYARKRWGAAVSLSDGIIRREKGHDREPADQEAGPFHQGDAKNFRGSGR
jgi:hypothetical protein